MVPHLQAVRQIAQGRRLVANMDIIGDHYTVAVGQRIPLINLDNKLGFKEASFSPELQIGVDMRAMAPTVKVLVSDDDYKGAPLPASASSLPMLLPLKYTYFLLEN